MGDVAQILSNLLKNMRAQVPFPGMVTVTVNNGSCHMAYRSLWWCPSLKGKQTHQVGQGMCGQGNADDRRGKLICVGKHGGEGQMKSGGGWETWDVQPGCFVLLW